MRDPLPSKVVNTLNTFAEPCQGLASLPLAPYSAPWSRRRTQPAEQRKNAMNQGQSVGVTPDQESLTIQLLRTREALMQHFRPMLASRDVSETQWRVLRSLYERGQLEASELAHVAAVMAPSLTRMLKVLEERKLITIARHPTDGRRVLISLSGTGHDFMVEALPEMQRIYARLSSVIDTSRMHALQKLLKEIAEMASAVAS
ncbi:MAG: homoprotocatechuate degradation operon regulator HpaR [Rhodanobacter sp.]